MSGNKRSWDAASNSEDWSHHPYAGAYASMNLPSNPSPLHYAYDTSSGAGPSRGGASGRTAGSEVKDEAEGSEDEDDEDDDDDDGKSTDNKKVKLGKDGKPKVKLTRGSR